MTWPTLQDYNEAIQNPRLNFGDPELKDGMIETNNLGLPRPITGAFATVYRIRCRNREWAVRCFQRDFTDHQQRYKAISQHLLTAKLQYIVGFEFVPQGIRVASKWYPILKMEWVKGELLHQYIKRNLKDAVALSSLAARWAAMLHALQSAGVAHGDLQHGNVLVANGELRLIDYDGMYVPALAGQSSHEVGHRNYQHPQRSEFDFGPKLDNFSAWVIYVSLLALSIDPGLWGQANAGDECLLFRHQDFEEPYSSEILNQLSKHSDQRLYTLASFFQSLLYSNPGELPTLDGQSVLQISSVSPKTIAGGSTKGLPSWLRDHVPSTQSPVSTQADGTSGNATWVLDFINPATAIEERSLEPDGLKPLVLVFLSAVTCGVLVGLYFVAVISLAPTLGLLFTAAITSAMLLRSLYRTDSVVTGMLDVRRRVVEEQEGIETLQRMIKTLEAKKVKAREKETAELKAIESQFAATQSRERNEKGQVQARLNLRLKTSNSRRQDITTTEAEALKKIQERTGSIVARLNNQIVALAAAERDELVKTLQNAQDQALRAHLMQRSIWQGTIPGVGEKLKMRLLSAGFRTAADVEYWRVNQVDGIGETKAMALVAWRDHLARFAIVPRTLSASDTKAIEDKYISQKQQLEAERAVSQRQLDAEVTSVRAKAKNEMKIVNDEQRATQDKADLELRRISERYAAEYQTNAQRRAGITLEANTEFKKLDEEISQVRKRTGDQHWQLAKVRRELMAYTNVSFSSYLRRVFGFSTS